MTAYYNEIDPFAAQWLRNLIAGGHIAPGDVDERSIEDVQADDLKEYTQCHFFAGIGGWSHALRLAMWPDDRPVWTGSCPCQPFSTAGKQGGSNDERHLWPVWFRLIRECGVNTVFGEQVEGAVGFGWLDRVFADLEDENYACGAAVLGAHSVGAPHIRQRLWWVADAGCDREEPSRPQRAGAEGCYENQAREWEWVRAEHPTGSTTGRLADAAGGGPQGIEQPGSGAKGAGQGVHSELAGNVGVGGLGNTSGAGLEKHRGHIREHGDEERESADGLPVKTCVARDGGLPDTLRLGQPGQGRVVRPVSTTPGEDREEYRIVDACGGHWQDAIAIPCADGKARRIEPSIEPLAHGIPTRMGQLRGYGNAIVPQAAAEFIGAYMDTAPC